MSLALALYQPDIALNTGAMLRLGACLDIAVHIIHPTGYPFSRAALRRSGMDYLDHVEIIEHAGFSAFDSWRRGENRRLVLLTTKAERSIYEAEFSKTDIFMMGRESAGVPESVAETVDLGLRIPMRTKMRSLNVATAAALVLGEAKRQTGGFT